jgi:hypothetical protein
MAIANLVGNRPPIRLCCKMTNKLHVLPDMKYSVHSMVNLPLNVISVGFARQKRIAPR